MTEKKKKTLVFSAAEILRFYSEVDTLRVRMDATLDYHYRGICVLSEQALKNLYELMLDSMAFKESLDSMFPDVKKGAMFQVSEENVMHLSKLTLMMGYSKGLLLSSGLSLESQ